MNLIDRTISFFSPKMGAERVQKRVQLAQFNDILRRYEAAGQGRRHAGWLEKSNPSVNAMIGKDIKTMVVRSREMHTNNGYASKAPGTLANNIIGTGIIPTPIIKDVYENGKLVKQSNTETILASFKYYWNEWADSRKCDFDEKNNFYALQILVIKTLIISGEVLIIKKSVTTDVNNLGIQLVVLEADFIDTSKDGDATGGKIINGVQYDTGGKVKGYWIYEAHPSDGGEKSNLVEIKDIIHLYDIDRPGQNRGVPLSASTLLKQRDLDDYEDAELMSKKTQACLAGFVTSTSPEGDAENDPIENIEPGMMQYLNPGENVTFTSPPSSSGFDSFVRTHQQAVASGYRMTYEMYTGDYSNVNFSSGRMGWIEFSRQVAYWQYLVVIPRFCDVVFEWFVERYKIIAGTDVANVQFGATWTAPRREMIDPTKETNARAAALSNGLQSWQETIRKDGYNPDDVLREMQEDQQRFVAAGLLPDWNRFLLMQQQKRDNQQSVKE